MQINRQKNVIFGKKLFKNGNFDISTYQNTEFANFAPFLQNGISMYAYLLYLVRADFAAISCVLTFGK